LEKPYKEIDVDDVESLFMAEPSDLDPETPSRLGNNWRRKR
jgi:hypothetical protein